MLFLNEGTYKQSLDSGSPSSGSFFYSSSVSKGFRFEGLSLDLLRLFYLYLSECYDDCLLDVRFTLTVMLTDGLFSQHT